jgi:hypothetical protein
VNHAAWAIGIGMLISAEALVPGRLYAGEAEARCSLATLNGQYLFAGSGTLFPPAFGVKTPSTATSAGFHIFNGDGTGTDFVTFSVNGQVQPSGSPVPITYTLKHDCTGTYTVQNGPKFDIFVAVDGSALTVIDTDMGAAISQGPQPRVGFQPINFMRPRASAQASAPTQTYDSQ